MTRIVNLSSVDKSALKTLLHPIIFDHAMENITRRFNTTTTILLVASLISKAQDPSSLNNKKESLRYVAVGSSLSAGVRDGGINWTSQKSSFPNLIATQLGVKDFKQPLLGDNDRYGTATVSAEVQEGVIKFTRKGEALLEDSKNDVMLPKASSDQDNWGIPYLKLMNLNRKESAIGEFLPTFERREYRHLDRFNKGALGKTTYINLIIESISEADLFTYEIGLHDFVSYYSDGGYGQSISLMTQQRESAYPEKTILAYFKNKGMKGVILNIPEVTKFPFFNFYTYEKLKSVRGGQLYIERYHANDIRMVDPRDLFVPSPSINNLFTKSKITEKGLSRAKPLSDKEVIGWEELVNVSSYNSLLKIVANEYDFPIVDLHTLYEEILSGTYITDDGVKIDPTYPTGNFFSSDGIHPSAIGQALIANETIKTLNGYYKMNTPLLKIAEIK